MSLLYPLHIPLYELLDNASLLSRAYTLGSPLLTLFSFIFTSISLACSFQELSLHSHIFFATCIFLSHLPNFWSHVHTRKNLSYLNNALQRKFDPYFESKYDKLKSTILS